MKTDRLLIFFVATVFAALVFVAPCVQQAQAQSPDPPAATSVSSALSETADLWFVELSNPPTAAGGSAAAIKKEQQAFRTAARQAGVQFKERFAFGTLWNGLSVKIDPAHLSALGALPGVKALYPVEAVRLPEGNPIFTPELFTSIGMIGADIAHSELGLTGAGVKVGVIDTGIDYHHPDLGGCFGTGCRVAVGYDFVGDAFDGTNTPVPDTDPMDCNGHGTHVAGIVGADGVVTGVAPGVTFGAYRVFGCNGSTWGDIMIAAMERALADGMQVVNMSIGSTFQWSEYPTAAAATQLVNKGVVVVCSAGNDAQYGLYSLSAPSVGTKVISVASYDNVAVTAPAFTITPDDRKVGYFTTDSPAQAPTSGTYPMARTGTKTTPDDACSALTPGSLTGKVALIRRGTCSFYMKSKNAEDAGAAAVVIYNNAAGFLNATVAGSPPLTIPVVTISKDDGELIDTRLAAGPVSMTWTNELTQIPNATGGLISSFSSYGLSPELDLKPDLGAPGGYIYSTYPLDKGGYAVLSGTSMSSPHVAGAVALLLEAKPHTPSQVVDTILQNTAVPALWSGNPGLGYLDVVNRQGAGMVHIDDAATAAVTIEPGELALGESQAGPATRTLRLENSGAAVTFDLSYVNALSTGGIITPAIYTSNAIVTFGSPSVTVPAGGTASVNATITAPTGPNKGQYGGYIVFTPEGGGQVYRVPFAGFVGDYQSIQVLAPTPNGFPWLSVLYAGSYYKVTGPEDWVYSMVGDDVPFFLVHLDHQARLLRMEAFDANTGKAWHRAFEWQYTSRSSSTASFFAISWDGTTTAGSKAYMVPNGQYVIKLSVLKALGNASSPADWETWTSPVIAIDRP